MTTTAQSTTWLIFRIGRVACAVPALAVETIVLPPEQLTALPGSDAGRPGLFRYGHETVAAIDLRYRFGLHDASHRSGRLLLGRVGPTLCGFWVDSIVGMVDSHELAPTTLPPELPHNVFTAALLYRKEIVLCSDLKRLHAMRDAGAALQRMVRPEPETEASATRPATDASSSNAATHAPAPTSTAAATPPAAPTTSVTTHTPATTSSSASRPVTSAPTHARPAPAAMPVQRTTSTAPRTQTATAQPSPSATRAATPRPTPKPKPESRRTATAPAPRTEAAPAARTPAAYASAAEPQADNWQESSSYSSPHHEEPATGKGIWVVLLLLLSLAAGGGAWYLLKPEARQTVQVVAAPPLVSPIPVPAVEPPPQPEPTTIAAPELAPSAAAQPVMTDSAPKTLATGKGIEVQQDREGITIIIERARSVEDSTTADAPVPAETDTSVADAGDAAMASATAPVEPAISEPVSPPPPSAPAPAAVEPAQMYVHTVVKGDTLWDIAERYLDDPWRYKDLAQLSRIKNPDLIYPGDKIRIIIR